MATYNTLSVPHLYVPSLSLPKINPPKLYIPRLTVPTVSTTTKLKREHVADLGDLVLGKPVVGTLELQHTLEDYGLDSIKYIPLVNSLTGLAIMTQERVIKPMMDGEPLKAAVNILETFGNSLDTVANPIKSLLPAAGGGTYDDFLKSMGWMDGSYRELYQWDTGNILVDFVGEVVSDPLNWFSLGGKSLLKAGADVTTDVMKIVAKETSEELVETATKHLARGTIKEFTEQAIRSDDLTKTMSKWVDEIDFSRRGLQKQLKHVDKGSEIYTALQRDIVNLSKLTNPQVVDKISEGIQLARNSDLFKHYRKIRGIVDLADKIDTGILTASAFVTPIGPAFVGGKWLVTKMLPALRNKALFLLDDVLAGNVLNNTPAAVQQVNDYMIPYTRAAHAATLDKFENLFLKYNLDLKRLQKIWMNTYYSTRGTLDDITHAFLQKLYKAVPELRNIVNKGIELWGIKPDDIRELALVLNDLGTTTLTVQQVVKNSSAEEAAKVAKELIDSTDVIEVLDNVQALINNTTDTLRKLGHLSMFDDPDIILELKRKGKSIKHPFTLKEAFAFIDHLENYDPELAQTMKSLLHKLGITPDNIGKVRSLYLAHKKGSTNALDKLKNLLYQSKQIVIQQDSVRTINDLTHTIKQLKHELDYNTEIIDFFKTAGVDYDTVIKNQKDLSVLIEQTELIYDELLSWLTPDLGTNTKMAKLNIDLNELYNAIDEIVIYPGIDEDTIPHVLLKNVFEYNLKTSDMDNVKQYLQHLEDLKIYVKRWKKTINQKIKEGSLKRNMYTRAIEDLDKIISDPKLTVDLDAFIKHIADENTYYALTMSAQNRFFILMQDLFLNSGSTSDWLKELANPTGTARKNLVNLIDYLRSVDSDIARTNANRLDTLLAAIDTSNNVLIAMDTLDEILNTFSYTGEYRQYLVNNIFDTIYKFRNESPATPNLAKQMTSSYIVQANRDIGHKVYADPKSELLDELYSMKAHIGEPDFDYDRYDELVMLTDATPDVSPARLDLKELEEHVESVFENYIANQARIAGEMGTTRVIKIYNTIDDYAIQCMLQLGLDYDDVIKLLVDNKAGFEHIETTMDFIQHVASNINNDTLINIERVLDDFLDNTKDYVQYSRLLQLVQKELIEEQSVDYIVRNVFRDIGLINKDLSNTLDVKIGKVLGKKGLTDLHAVTVYVTKAQFDAFIRRTTLFDNAYAWTIYNGRYSVKKLNDPYFNTVHKLTNRYLYTDCIEHYTLVTNLKKARHTVDTYIAYNIPNIQKLRDALIEFYSSTDIPYRPKHPELYFNELDPEDILAWDLVTSRNIFGANRANRYKDICNKYKVDIRDKMLNVFKQIDAQFDDNITIEDEFIDNLINNLSHSHLGIVTDTTVAELEGYIKDPASLNRFHDILTKYITEDVGAINNLEPLNKLSKSNKRVRDVISNEMFNKYYAVFKRYNITRNTRLASPQVFNLMCAERTEALVRNLNMFTPRQLRTWLKRNTPGAVIVHTSSDVLLLKHSKEALEEAGLVIRRVKNAPDLIFIASTGADFIEEEYTYKIPKYLFQKEQDEITKVIKANRNYVDFDTIDIPDELWTGDCMDATVYDAMLDSDLLVQGFDVERKLLQNNAADGLNSFYKKTVSRPNLFIIGSPHAYNVVLDYCSGTFKTRGLDIIYKPLDIVKRVYSGQISSIRRVNKTHKYLQLFFNGDFDLDAPMFRRVLSNATDEELQQLFKRNNYVVCILKQDSKGRPVVYKIAITNKAQLADAVKANAIIVPQQIYTNMVYTINRHTLNSKLLNFYKRTIVGTFKTIYLTSIGFLFRNAADSLIYKNAAATDGVVGVLENFKYEYRAMKMLEMYNNIQKEAMSRLGENKGKFNRYLINKVLLDKDAETQAVYKIVDLFINTSASGGLTKSLQDYLLNFNLTQKGYNGFWFEKYWNDMMTNLPPMKQVQDINSTIEQSARLGLFLKLVDTGEDYSSAIRKVIDTHFNYDLKEPGIELMEQIFWFSTFPINNFMFYINEGITKNPELIKMQLDLLEQSYNSNGITWEDTRNSKYLTNNVLSGNLRIYSKDSKGVILKTGSSVMDFFNILVNPTSEMIDRLNPYLSVLFGIEDIEQLLPWITIQNRLEQVKEGRSYIPSLYAKLYEDRKPKTQIPRNYKKSYWRPKARKRYFKRANNEAILRSMQQATRRYSLRQGRYYWTKKPATVDPSWYTHSAAYKRTNRSINRKLRSYYKTR